MSTHRMIDKPKEPVFGLGERPSLQLALCIAFACSTSAVTAADWIISPAILVEQVYTDNALLTQDNEEDDSITRVRPSLSLYKEGARASLDFNYAPEYRHYWQDTEDNEVVHLLRAEGNVELYENTLFLDGWANADRSNVTSSGRVGLNGLTGTADDTDVYSIGLSPYLTARFGGYSVLEVRYTGDRVDYSEDGPSDSVGHSVDIVLGSGSYFTNQIWEVSAFQKRVDYEALDDDNESSIFRAELVQQLTHQWALAFAAGYEEYILAVTEDSDGSLWSLGAIYTPTPRTRIAAGFGERSFGDDYFVDFSHRSSRTLFTAEYERDFISARDEVGRQTLFQRQDAFGNLVRDPILEDARSVTRSGTTPTLTEDFYEIRRFITGFTYQTPRTLSGIRGAYTERIYDDSARDTEDLDIALNFVRRLTRLTEGVVEITWHDHDEALLTYDQWVASLGLSYQLGSDASVAMSLSHMERDADPEAGSYEENHVSVSFNTRF
ncbi:MAG: TIGR03016 family PEP-CTERM system-associated outer membrane protein [Candidatus Thiodiazotropha sp. (ex Dulcina madagascariensis)]|nr:TIGR03016 family PEP-CTERM system-associated outer membrane protein [Candidatus Thiodiazotropha sp. (ex Dulcina madagascariensis)]MCU7925275.1 TIGR03016 family PEP-CTERM system-associated outer membrane protein [Candidatus Thiodiazotropha sp. (ex Dulcina madagascariensis)]